MDTITVKLTPKTAKYFGDKKVVSEQELLNSHIEEVEPDEWELQAMQEHDKAMKNGTAEFVEYKEFFKTLNT